MTRRLWRMWAAAFGAAAVLGIAFAAQDAAFRTLEDLPVRWDRLLRFHALFWAAWALFVPAIAETTERIPLEPAQRWRRLPVWIGLGLGISLLHAAVTMSVAHNLGWIAPPPPPAQPRLAFGIWVTFTERLAGNLLYFALIAAAFHGARYSRVAKERATRLAIAELDVLRMQLHPHFFFNTLNTVSALLEKDPEAAREVLAKLGDLLRLSMEGVDQEVALERELDMLQRYVDIQRARYGDRLSVVVHVDEGLNKALVPSLLLQPLVENSVRHALEPHRERVTTTVEIRRATSNRVRIDVTDDGPGTAATRPGGRGVGLANTRARLLYLYGAAQSFVAGPRSNGPGFTVTIVLPLKT